MNGKIRHALNALLAATLLATSLNAGTITLRQEKTKEKPKDIISWPAVPSPKASTSIYRRSSDGYTEELLQIRVAGLDILMDTFGSWRIDKTAHKDSFRLRIDRSSILFSIATFDPEVFLPDLELENWSKYVASIQAEDSKFQFISEDSNIEKAEGIYVLGQKYRRVIYEKELPGDQTYQIQKAVFHYKGKVYVFTFEGPAEEMEATKRIRRMILSRTDFTANES